MINYENEIRIVRELLEKTGGKEEALAELESILL